MLPRRRKFDCTFPSRRYDAAMTEIMAVRSALPKILARERLTVADLVRRMEETGFQFDKKTIYRLAKGEPMRTLNLPIVAAIGQALKLKDPGKLILWSSSLDQQLPRLRRIDADTQARLDELMSKNTEGSLNASERRELGKLGRLVEELSLANAHLLASHTQPQKKKKETALAKRPRRQCSKVAS